MKQKLILLFFVLNSISFLAQTKVNGNITDTNNNPIVGATIIEKGTTNSVFSDNSGNFSITTKNANSIVIVSYTGYIDQEYKANSNLKIVLETVNVELESVVIQAVGSRNTKRTIVDSPVPVDVINVAEIQTKTGQVEINAMLQYVAPSFNASRQSGSDGADHIDPATLRGLGPDQTLVLINGKRRHQSSLVNLFGSRGRGNTGTDMNAIPAASIKRIEILRDGAAAQYGSDAIAGVVNIVLKEETKEFTGNLTLGAYDTSNPYKGKLADNKNKFDGESIQFNGNYGFKLGSNGFLNSTLEIGSRGFTNRLADESAYSVYRKQFGDAKAKNAGFMLNSGLQLSDKTNFYFFGGANYRDSDGYAFTRDPDSARNIPSIYPDGFDPLIGTRIIDGSLSAGIKSLLGKWSLDFNNTFGINNFKYDITNTLNASLQQNSPREFDAGGHQLWTNTTGLNLNRNFDYLDGLSVATGVEYRMENFQIFSGEEKSYALYDINGAVVTNNTNPNLYVIAPNGDPRPGGSQGFPGYSPENVVNKSRGNIAAFVDTELDFDDSINLAAAIRYENYTDFGSTLTAKIAQRFKFTNAFAMRYSLSTGFRAPSLVQKYYNLKFTDFINGVGQETLLAGNDSQIAKDFGIPSLNEEKSFNASLGYTYKLGKFTATVDGYFVKIYDRIVLTGKFDGSNLGQNISNVQFFTNALNTQTVGVDFVFSYDQKIGSGVLSASFLGNINKMRIGKINSVLDEETLFGKREKAFLIASAPESKLALNLNYLIWGKLNISTRFTRFGEVELIDFLDTTDYYGNKIVSDFSVNYPFTKSINLTVGVNNFLNVYPDIQDTETETGGNFDSVQMGANGRFAFWRLGFKF